MKTTILMLMLPAAILCAAASPAAGEEAFKLSTLSVADKLLYVEDEDLNLDGLNDILIVHRKGLRPEETRWVSVFWQMEDGGFSTAADQSWEIDSLAISLDIGNVVGDDRREICVLTPAGVSYYPINGGQYVDRLEVLFETDGLLPEPGITAPFSNTVFWS